VRIRHGKYKERKKDGDMVEKVITTALLTIGSVICATALIAVMYPTITSMASPFQSTTEKVSDRVKTDIKIIAEANTSSHAYIWVKNIGKNKIPHVDDCDVFYGPEGNFKRIASADWSYTIENDGGNNRWDIGETINITISNQTLDSGDYYVKIVTYNGIWDDDEFSI